MPADAATEPDTGDDADDGEVPARRPLGRSILLGLGVGIGVGAIAFFLIAIPFYTLASFEANGLDRPVVRTGLLRIALPAGATIGVVSGAVVGRWLRRGGSWTVDDGGGRYTNDRFRGR